MIIKKIANLFSTFFKDDLIIIYENQLWCHSFGSQPVVSTRKTEELKKSVHDSLIQLKSMISL